VLQAWDVLGGGRPPGRRVLVADWGGDPAGLAVAELLAGAGYDVLLASSSLLVGESVHQYARARSLERLYRAGVTIVHHHALAGAGAEGVRVRNVLAPDLESEVAADAVVVALGRVPAGDPWEDGAAPGIPFERAGDCLGPRSLEEAILEGTLAARAAA
jgi:pyruvate/2-oxoglutarate dehydrogenase complex dihydrolipoamide dehydrogenase (E3) component